MKKVLLTGGTGFVGSNILKELSKSYQIYRTFNRQKADYHKIQMKQVELREILDEESEKRHDDYPLIHSGNTSVDSWINKRIGSCSDFLLSYMISQNQDCDFLSKKPSEQIDIIDRSINFESVRSLLELLNTCSNSYKYMSDHFDTILNTEVLLLTYFIIRYFILDILYLCLFCDVRILETKIAINSLFSFKTPSKFCLF